MSLPMVQAFFDEMQLYGGEFDWSDEIVQTFGDLAIKGTEAAEALSTLNNQEVKVNVSDIVGENATDTLNKQLSVLDGTINQMNALKSSKIGIDSSQVSQANDVIQYCVAQKQLLTQPDVMRVDVSQVSGEVGNAIGLLQDFQRAGNNVEILASVNADTSGAEADVQGLYAQIAALPAEVLAQLHIDPSSISSVQSSIQKLDAGTINVDANVNASAISGFNAKTETVDVIYNPLTDTLPQSFEPITRNVNYSPNTSGLPNSFPTITRTVNYVKSGDVEVNGTAHAAGTAFAGGNWGTAPGGNTLVGELGREIVVDTRSGRWYTVGDNGAEFTNIPAGSIVFNHRQTEDLLSHGYVAGRARALAGGTAMVSGGYRPMHPSHNDDKDKPNFTPTYHPATDRKKDDKDEKLDDVDWIEILIDRIERAIDRIKRKVDSAFKSLETRLGALPDAIKKINEEIRIQESGAKRYREEAETIDLSEGIKEKIRNGSIDIAEYDEDTRKLIEDYKKWYEKSLDCSDAAQQLKEDLSELYLDGFKSVEKEFDNQISMIEHAANQYENAADLIKEKGYLESEEYYTGMKGIQGDKIQNLNQKLANQQAALDAAMKSGQIEKYSEAWYEMQISINDTKEEISKAEIELQKLDNGLMKLHWDRFDYAQSRINQINEEADFLIDILGRNNLYDDSGKLNDNGNATMGLHGQKYNTYMSQADEYAREIKSLNAEIAKDPSNTILIKRREELLDLQRNSIKAAEDEKDAMVDLVEDGINKELDALKELIDKYKETLDTAKSLHDYQNKVSNKADEISILQKQLSAFSGDTSDEGRSKVQKIQEELSKAQKDLEETEYNHGISEQKKLLDELYTEYEDALNSRLDNIDSLIEGLIGDINENADTIVSTLEKVAGNVGYTMTDETSQIWYKSFEHYGGIVAKYGDEFSSQITATRAVIDDIHKTIQEMIPSSGMFPIISNGYDIPMVDYQDFFDKLEQANKEPKPEKPHRPNRPNNPWFDNGFIPPNMRPYPGMHFGNIYIHGVKDYEEFLDKLKNDNRFEGMIRSMTTDQLRGASKFNKYKW